MKIITYKCDICGTTFPESKKADYILHLKKHAIFKKFTKEAKSFCCGKKQEISDLFACDDVDVIQHNFICNKDLILEYILRKYFLSNISSYIEFSVYDNMYKSIMNLDIVLSIIKKEKTDDSYHIIFGFNNDIHIDRSIENNFGNGTFITMSNIGLKLILKKQQHKLENF